MSLGFAPPINIFLIVADLLQVLVLVILAEVVVSWLTYFGSVSAYKPWVRNLHKVTDPILNPLRRLIPPYKLRGIDLSPFLAIIVIQIVQGFLYNAGVRMASRIILG